MTTSKIKEKKSTAVQFRFLDPKGDPNAGKPENREHLETALKQVMAQEALDGTNPWYPFARGMCLKHLGRDVEAKSAFEAVLKLDTQYDAELMPMALFLDPVDPALGDRAFRRAMQFLLKTGYEPELSQTAISLMIHYGTPHDAETLDPVKDVERIKTLGERIWAFSPYAEGASLMFGGVASACRKAGQENEAAKWDERRRLAEPYRFFGGANLTAERAGHMFTLLMAACLGLFLLVVIKSLRTVSTCIRHRKDSWVNRYIYLNLWTRQEALCLPVFLVVFWFASHHLVVGIQSIAVSAASPIEGGGHVGTPAGLAYWKKAQGSPGGDFIHAISLQQSGDLDAADAVYANSKMAEAANNRGVIANAKGNTDEAKGHFTEALKRNPELAVAKFNLGQTVSTPQTDRANEYGRKAPLLALPTPEVWTEALVHYDGGGSGNPFAILSMMNNLENSSSSGSIMGNLVTFMIVVLAILGLVAAFLPQRYEEQPGFPGLVAWILALLIPGTGRRWGILGVPVLLLFFSSYLIAKALADSQGYATNMLEAMAVPNFTKMYGVTEFTMPELTAWVRGLAFWWWVLLLVNVVYMLAWEFLKPEKAGLLAFLKSRQVATNGAVNSGTDGPSV